MKIYTMIGLPTEEDEDLKGQFDITISTSTFIPKAQTPFEKAERVDKKILEKRINYLKKAFHKMGVTFRPSSVDWDVIQSILSRYDESLADLLIQVVDKGGNLGAFKQTWKEFSKKGLIMPFEEASKLPFKTEKPNWKFIKTK